VGINNAFKMTTQLRYDGWEVWEYNIDECKERTNGKDGNTWMNARTMNQNIKCGH
jgi:hypothetical protein